MEILNENDIMTPYEKTINGETMTLKQLTEHLDEIADNDGTMSSDEFKNRLESATQHSKTKNLNSKNAQTNRF